MEEVEEELKPGEEKVTHKQVSPEVLASFTRSGPMAWRWKNLRMREKFQYELLTELDCDDCKRALDESARNKSLFRFFQKILYWK